MSPKHNFLLALLILVFWEVEVNADTVLILGGEVDSLLHPSVTSVEAFGPCGIFDSGIPDLPKPRRDFAASLYGSDLVVCGGNGLLSAQKDCSTLTLDTWPLEWRDFPPLNHGRKLFGLVELGPYLYAVGGSQAIGSQISIERFDGSKWEEIGETNGYRQDFCTLAWGDDGILTIGGYDDFGEESRTELYNTTTNTWTLLHKMDIGRGMHACAHYQGGVAVAGGWTFNNDPDFPGQEVTRTSAWYDPVQDAWTDLGIMRNRRTKFALEVVNGTLTAIGGWEGFYTESIEQLGPDGGWDWFEESLGVQKAGFGVVKVTGLLEDENCT